MSTRRSPFLFYVQFLLNEHTEQSRHKSIIKKRKKKKNEKNRQTCTCEESKVEKIKDEKKTTCEETSLKEV